MSWSMPCEQPVRIKNSKYRGMTELEVHQYSQRVFGVLSPPDYYLYVPCGWCFSCNRRKYNGYNLRLKYEVMQYPNSSFFVTLTFDNKYLSKFKNDTNKAVRLFLDRYRKKSGKQVRHFFIAEYGEKHGRIHYHGLLFDAPINTKGDLQSLWKYGLVDVQKADSNAPNYLTKYMTKGTDCEKLQPRVIISKGLGKSFLNHDSVKPLKRLKQPYFDLGNKKIIPLPRYYVNHLFTADEKREMLLDRVFRPFERDFHGTTFRCEEEYLNALKGFHQMQVQRDLSPKKKPPVAKRKHKQSKLRTIQQNEF